MEVRLVLISLCCLIHTAHCEFVAAGDPRIEWAGRTSITSAGVAFDWVGVTARLSVTHATYVTMTATTTRTRGTRMRVWCSDAGSDYAPQVQVYVSNLQNTSVIFLGNSPSDRLITVVRVNYVYE